MRILVVGDIHLHHHAQAALRRDMAQLIRESSGAIVLSGDVYDLAAAGHGPVLERLEAIATYHREVHDALAAATAAGRSVTLIPGNHDMEMADLAASAWFTARTGGKVVPWFHRIAGTTPAEALAHIEHGSQYDPDNAHPHPLASSGDPLGVLITRRIVSHLGDLRLLPHNDNTPLPLLIKCFANYGMRTPRMVARYIWTGVALTARGARGLSTAHALGRSQESAQADGAMLSTSSVRDLAALSVTPRRANRWPLIRRMYLDRIAATAVVAGVGIGVVIGVVTLSPLSAVGGAIAAAFLLPNRYRGKVAEQLAQAAEQIAVIAPARWVIMGHAHEPRAEGRYLNTGSFGVPSHGQRTYVEIDDAGAAHLRAFVASKDCGG